jgi:hypothetical protein
MLMRLSHADAAFLYKREGITSVIRQDDDLEKMAYIKEGKRRNETSG